MSADDHQDDHHDEHDDDHHDEHDDDHHDEHDDHGHGGGGDVEVHVGQKAGALCTLLFVTLIASLAPIYIRKRISKSSSKWKEIVLSGVLCFGAGVLLATVFLHILPETSHQVRDAMNDGLIAKSDFPIAEAVVCCGFFIIYLIEDIVHTFIGHSHNKVDDTENSNLSSKNIITVSENVSNEKNLPNGIDNKGYDGDLESEGISKEKNLPNGIDNKGFEGDLEGDSKQSQPSSEPPLLKADTSTMKAVTVVAAISFHGIMEGLAIGLEQHVMDMWLLMGVICIHKLIIAFSMGMELLQVGVKLLPFLAAMITFSLASPLGGIIGAATLSLKEETAAGIMVPAVINGLAGGSILYIVFCEILERERKRQSGSFLIIVTLMAGFGLMCGLQFIPGHSH